MIANNYVLNLKRRIFDKTVYEVDSSVIPHNYYSVYLLLCVCVCVNWYNNRLLPVISQFFLIPNRINEFMDLCAIAHVVK
jgi:hypothetical protein